MSRDHTGYQGEFDLNTYTGSEWGSYCRRCEQHSKDWKETRPAAHLHFAIHSMQGSPSVSISCRCDKSFHDTEPES
ncbi:unnamed protein product [Victoria cruziana]